MPEAATASYRILEAEFTCSAPNWGSLPTLEQSEVVFVGRSNVGKSSLINALCSRKGLAFTSKTPGRTQLFNYYKVRCRKQVGEEAPTDFLAYLVDVPGYGYAKVSKRDKARWKVELERYLLERKSLNAVMMLVDCRRKLEEEEHWISQLGEEGGLTVVLTKSDKLNAQQLRKSVASIKESLSVTPDNLVVTSCATKRKGMVELTRVVCRSLEQV